MKRESFSIMFIFLTTIVFINDSFAGILNAPIYQGARTFKVDVHFIGDSVCFIDKELYKYHVNTRIVNHTKLIKNEDDEDLFFQFIINAVMNDEETCSYFQRLSVKTYVEDFKSKFNDIIREGGVVMLETFSSSFHVKRTEMMSHHLQSADELIHLFVMD